jgi:uncharacterized protein (TIGR02594 family)
MPDPINTTQPSRWAKLAAIVAIVATIAGFLGNLDKIGKFVKDWMLPSKPPAPPTIIVQITRETLLEAAGMAKAAALSASGPDRTEALKEETQLRKVAEDPRATLAPADAASTPRWLTIAFAELGQTEVQGEKDNPRILEYLDAVSLPESMRHDETPWTSAFANWAFSQAGVKGTKSANPAAWLKWGRELSEPKLGALVLLKRSGQPVGTACFFLSQTSESIVCLGGNFRNSVSITAAPRDSLLGYRWPE